MSHELSLGCWGFGQPWLTRHLSESTLVEVIVSALATTSHDASFRIVVTGEGSTNRGWCDSQGVHLSVLLLALCWVSDRPWAPRHKITKILCVGYLVAWASF